MAWQPAERTRSVIRLALFALCIAPMLRLVWGGYADALGTNPIETITRATGWWCLFFLCITLSVTPLRHWTGQVWLLRLRRMLGLYAFFYACAHLTTFIWFDHWFDLVEMFRDVLKRPFITVGFSAFLLMLPLALTSSKAMVRLLGRRWQVLHQLIYLVAVLGVVHYWWLVKRDLTEPILFALVLAVLLGVRVRWRLKQSRAR